jgi:hypothetical protein
MYIEQVKEIVPPPGQNTVAVGNEIALLTLRYIRYRLVIFRIVTDAPIHVSDTRWFKYDRD